MTTNELYSTLGNAALTAIIAVMLVFLLLSSGALKTQCTVSADKLAHTHD